MRLSKDSSIEAILAEAKELGEEMTREEALLISIFGREKVITDDESSS